MVRLRVFSLAAACSVLGCAAAGLPDAPVMTEYNLPQKDFRLGSGLRVLVQQDRSAPIVTVVAYYGVGSTSDPKGVEGLAHLVEHLAFKSKPGGVPIWDHYKRLGASMNAFTEYDFTGYFATAHKDHLNALLQIEAWRLLHTLDDVTAAELAIEREIVRNELRQRGETTVGNQVFDKVMGATFPTGHPLARPIGGTHESVSSTTLQHARAFVKEHYTPSNCTIVVSGDLDVDEVGKLLGMWPPELLFGPGGAKGPAVASRKKIADRPPPPVPARAATSTLVRHKAPLDQPLLLLAWPAPPGRRGNDALLRFVSARLSMAFREGLEFKEDDDIEGVGAGIWSFGDGSVLLVEASLKPGADPERARGRVLDSIMHAWTTEFGRALTEQVRWFSATSLLLQTAEPVGKAMALAEHLATTGTTHYFKESLQELAKVQSVAAMDIAAQYLRRDRAAAVYFEPEGGEAPRLVGGGPGGSTTRQQHTIGETRKINPEGMGREAILKVALAPKLAALPRFRLANGLELVAARHGSAPVAQVRVGIKGGDALTKPYGLASFAQMFTMARSTDHGSLDPVGGRIFDFGGDTSSNVYVDTMSGNLPNGIAVLSDFLASAEVHEETFLHRGRLLERMKKRHERRSKQPEFVAGKRMQAELFRDHPYGIYTIDPSALESLSYADASTFVRAHYRPGNAIAVVVGDIDPAEVRKLGDKYLSRWSGGGGGATAVSVAPGPTARKVFLVDRPKATQAQVAVACRLLDGAPERVAAYDVLGELADERAEGLREEWGATYGVHGAAYTLPGGSGALILRGMIETPQAGRGVARLLDIFAELGSDRLREDLFLLKRWDVARRFSYRFSTGESIAEAVLSAAEHGWPTDVWDRYPERLAATTPGTVRELMKPCVGKEIVTIVGDAAVVRPQLEAAGLTLEAN